jgi:P-type Mg2+ transporter
MVSPQARGWEVHLSPMYSTHQVAAAIQPYSAVQMTGLRASEVRYLQKEFGPNEIGGSRKRSLLLQLLGYLTQPLVAVLLVAAVISAVLGDMVNASIIVVMVLGSIGLDFVQTRRSQQAAERLRSSVAPTVTVLRDGQWLECPRRELVPGDVIALSAGNLVPADAQLLQAKDLHVQQAALTGESMPVEKEVESNVDATKAVLERRDLVFLGSSIVSGRADAVVTATGLRTQFGGIAASLETKPPETEFERGTRAFGFFIMQTILFLVLLVFAVSALNSRPVLESLLFAVALAVGLTPEFLPMIQTITLSNGAIRMAKRHVIVKNLASIQNFGAMDVLATDKTGTLTSGEMQLEAHMDASGAPSERVFLLGYLKSLFDTGVDDPHSQAVLARARSNPLDAAILKHDHPDVQPYHKLDELPFDFERRRVSVVVDRSGQHLLITKGAPESVLEVCTKVRQADLEQDLNDMLQADCLRTFERLSAQGARVLAIASRSIADDAQQTAYQIDAERDLTLEGLLSFSDPPLPDTNAVLGELKDLGVRVVILTGDNELVAQHVCETVGLEVKRVVLGSELERMTDAALFAVVENASLFARVSPAQKPA